MATVYRAESTGPGPKHPDVAVKVLASDRSSGYSNDRRPPCPDKVGRFEREISLLGRVQGRGTPLLIEHGVHEGDRFLVMEFVEGVNLDEFRKNQLPSRTANVCIVHRLVEILRDVHREGIVHRDIKPANIMLRSNGELVLVDFGIGWNDDPRLARHTMEGSSLGTLGFQAPELIEIKGDPTPAADIYSVACLFFYLVMGYPVFKDKAGDSRNALWNMHLNDVPPRLDALVRGFPEDLADLVQAMFAKAPADRPAHAEILRVLAAHVARPGDPAPSPSLTPDPTRPFREAGTAPSGLDRPRSVPAPRPPRGFDPVSFTALIAETEAELGRGEAGVAHLRLGSLLPAARRSRLGSTHPDVALARALCAEALRREEGVEAAAGRWRTLVEDLRHVGSREPLAAVYAEALIGVAESLIPTDPETAVRLWYEAVSGFAGWSEPPVERLVRRARDVGGSLASQGFESEVTEGLGHLPYG
ncbi:serine/threonine protein kinase [Streptomyces sp. NPDC004126]|uniref:serine/threonine protein kinase n=1 Tax=Streptomyces sp. NPDC004126 TaxID=3390695 RepID=UPI003D010A65